MNIARFAAKINGLVRGIGIGIYDDAAFQPNQECLSKKEVKSIYELYMNYEEGGGILEKSLSLITRSSVLIEDLSYRCDMQIYVYETITVCMVSGDCSLWIFFVHWSMNFGAVMLNFVQVLLTIIFEPSYHSIKRTYDCYARIG